MWHARREKKCMLGFGGGPKERDHLEDLSVDEGITFQGILKKYGMACNRFI